MRAGWVTLALMIYAIAGYIEPALLLIVVSVLVYRRFYRQFPFFFTYVLSVLSVELIRFMVHRFRTSLLQYFYTYWITEALEVALGFLVLYEVFLIRLFPGFNITVIYRRLFPIVGIIVIAMTAWMFFGASSSGPSKIVAFVGASTLALSFCQVAFLTFLGGLMLYMSREWRRHELGIAVGFGFYGAVKLFVTLELAKHFYGPIKVEQIPAVAYLIAVGIWLFFLSKSDPEPEETPITEEMVEQVEKVYGDVSPLLRKARKKRWD